MNPTPTDTLVTSRSLRRRFAGRRSIGRPGGRPGLLVWLSFAVLAAVIAWAAIPALSAGALTQDIIAGAAPPGDGHPLGTDALGRDVWRLTMAGARTALAGPIAIAAGSMLFGLLLGLVAAYRGGLVDWIICRYVELMLSLPSLLLAIVAAGVIGGGYWISVVVLLILFSPYDIRLIR
ncbi:MAG: ABC transporter permease subunit, partial [Bifidobacteriaceae bacterium]|nr:ABC transporter permease subunit [Bifidobacteriaceae bacterium]